jgi:SagB-type dehydrogenase family enzyme
VFHTRSTGGRHANPMGGVYRYAGAMAPKPAVRPRWPGKAIDLGAFSAGRPPSPLAKLLRERHSTRTFDDQHPVALAELAQFLDGAARVLSVWTPPPSQEGEEDSHDFDTGPQAEIAPRPYPSAGSSYELELYLAVDKCEGLGRGFYHYDAGGHTLVPIDAGSDDLDALLGEAAFAMDAMAAPQVLITIAARFGRVSWKYSSIAYSLILKDTGVLLQTLYLTATEMGLGGCATGITNIDLFARMTGMDFHVESPVGQFAFGRPGDADALDSPW